MKEKIQSNLRISIINLYYQELRNCHGVEKEKDELFKVFIEMDLDLIIKDERFYNAKSDTSGINEVIANFDRVRRDMKLNKILNY